MKNTRKPEYPVDQLFLNRRSPYAFSGEEITDEELMTLFEAAKWAPSSYNGQPWRFIYAKRNTPHWDTLFNLMVAFNQSWTKNTAVIVVVVSRETFEFNGKPAVTHTFDSGSAWMSVALQASLLGLYAHGMEGFDYARAKKDLNVPDGYKVEAMFAVGKLGKRENLPPALQEREAFSDRKTLKEIVFEGTFQGK